MRRNLLSILCMPLICIILIAGFNIMTAYSAAEPIYEGLKDGREFTLEADTIIESGASVNIGSTFTLQATLSTEANSGCQVLFAKGHKTAGHFELWLLDGYLSFYAPEINAGQAIYHNIFVADGMEHIVVFAYNNGKWCVYLDNVKSAEGITDGAVSSTGDQLAIGSLLDGSFEYTGYLKDIKIYDKCLDDDLPEPEPQLEAVSCYEAFKDGKTFAAGHDSFVENNVTVNVGGRFTLSAIVETNDEASVAVTLFARGPKLPGHYELWMNYGKLAFYAPEINGGGAIYTDIFIADGKKHHVAFTYDNGIWYAYLDGTVRISGVSSGTVSDKDWKITFGSLEDGGYEFIGYMANVRIDTECLSPEQIKKLIPDSIEPPAPYEPAVRKSSYDPVKYSPVKALRGAERLAYLTAIPYIDLSATTGYEGSISKFGDNADWDWSIYKDEKGEYVLFEAYGAGCLYNFTQHRYPTSQEPTFNFYLDDADTPAYSIKQSEFGKKTPFLSPVSDIYEGPEDNGRGPIWVIRSFVPMEFTKYCKVTSTVELLGNDKSKGEGGWGHVTYVMYDTADGLKTFIPEEDAVMKIISSLSKNLTFDPKYSAENDTSVKENILVKAGKTVDLFEYSGEGSVSAVKLVLKEGNAAPENLSKLRIRIYWDNQQTAAVDAPIGTFFGNEYGYTKCDNTLMMLGTEIVPMSYFKGYNYFPMPFWSSVKMELYSVSDRDITVSEVEIHITPANVCKYDKTKAGYFVSSPYYEKTANIFGKNSVIAELKGTGHMVYGVLSGYGIGSGCEGDVRVFFDGRESPEMESDGSESWASYGWGFVTPPECNPFSGYNGMPNSNSDWSEVRLTLGDSYFFKTSIRFELEHGGANEGMGSHSGQIFCYMLPDGADKSSVTDTIDLSDEKSLNEHKYEASGDVLPEKINSAYANGLNTANSFSGTVFRSNSAVSFDISLNAENRGVVLNRTFSQKQGRQAAKVYVDNVEVTERIWYTADSNSFYCWADDYFQIPARYTAGKSRVRITIEPMQIGGESITWNAASYEVISVMGNARSGLAGDRPNPPEDNPDNPVTSDAGFLRIFALTAFAVLAVLGIIGVPFVVRRIKIH